MAASLDHAKGHESSSRAFAPSIGHLVLVERPLVEVAMNIGSAHVDLPQPSIETTGSWRMIASAAARVTPSSAARCLRVEQLGERFAHGSPPSSFSRHSPSPASTRAWRSSSRPVRPRGSALQTSEPSSACSTLTGLARRVDWSIRHQPIGDARIGRARRSGLTYSWSSFSSNAKVFVSASFSFRFRVRALRVAVAPKPNRAPEAGLQPLQVRFLSQLPAT